MLTCSFKRHSRRHVNAINVYDIAIAYTCSLFIYNNYMKDNVVS